jgi:type III secretory pathway component EscU
MNALFFCLVTFCAVDYLVKFSSIYWVNMVTLLLIMTYFLMWIFTLCKIFINLVECVARLNFWKLSRTEIKYAISVSSPPDSNILNKRKQIEDEEERLVR